MERPGGLAGVVLERHMPAAAAAGRSPGRAECGAQPVGVRAAAAGGRVQEEAARARGGRGARGLSRDRVAGGVRVADTFAARVAQDIRRPGPCSIPMRRDRRRIKRAATFRKVRVFGQGHGPRQDGQRTSCQRYRVAAFGGRRGAVGGRLPEEGVARPFQGPALGERVLPRQAERHLRLGGPVGRRGVPGARGGDAAGVRHSRHAAAAAARRRRFRCPEGHQRAPRARAHAGPGQPQPSPRGSRPLLPGRRRRARRWPLLRRRTGARRGC
mmetsp:Transcript_68912/g.179531  ORF Transcript_68912/g.179531 Transcript_68912/m.179531 type:complete len:270 (+) Transcript_68912:194-1003(+)